MHEDGLGPSRLLFARQLGGRFAQGFTFFYPERSIAIVLASTASPKVRASVEDVVTKCFARADVPMSKTAFDHSLLNATFEEAREAS